MSGTTSRKVNTFSIFKILEKDNYIVESSETNYGTSERIYIGDTLKYYGLIGFTINKGDGLYNKIPHFDNIVGLRLMMYCITGDATGQPIKVHELNNDTTKYFTETGSNWNAFRDGSDIITDGALWAESGGDFDTQDLAEQWNSDSEENTWQVWNLDQWAKSKSFKDGDEVNLLLSTLDGDELTLGSYYSRQTTSTGTLHSTCWRGGNVYYGGVRTSTYLYPAVEIIYEDEVPDPITDFKIESSPTDPRKMLFKWSESSAEDLQGYVIIATTLPTQDFAADQYGWVDTFATGAGTSTITCGGMASSWATDEWNSYYLLMTSGKKKGTLYTITDTGNATGVLSLSETLASGDLGYNDRFIIIKTALPSTTSGWVSLVRTNRGYFLTRAPDDDYEVYMYDYNSMTQNVKYYFYVMPMDNLAVGPLGVRSNIIEFVKPLVTANTYFKIRASSDDAQAANIDVFEDCYVDLYGTGAQNTASALKGIRKMEVYTGEHTLTLDTYVTTITAQWSSGTSITVDLTEVPKEYFQVGQKVVITDATNAELRTITAVGDNTVVVDSAPGNTFNANTSIIYPTKTFCYTTAGALTNKCKARVINEYGFASEWMTMSSYPAPVSIPGVGAMGVSLVDSEASTDTTYFNMTASIPKPSNKAITSYCLFKDNSDSITEYTTPVKSTTYTTAGTKYPYMFIYDADYIISPGFDLVYDYDAAPSPTYNDRTVKSHTYTSSDMLCLRATSDILYLGFKRPFDAVYIYVGTAWTGLTFTKQYYNGSWTTLTVTDGTSNFATNGVIRWTRPTDWVATSVNSSSNYYWVRFTVSAITSPGDADYAVPLELGMNYYNITVTSATSIDLNSTSVLKNGFEFSDLDLNRIIYQEDGVLGTSTKQGTKNIPRINISGVAYTASSLLLSSFDGSGIPQFAGAANSNILPDDIQTLESIYNNGYLIKFVDRGRNTRYGYIKRLNYPRQSPGHPRYEWSAELAIDYNR